MQRALNSTHKTNWDVDLLHIEVFLSSFTPAQLIKFQCNPTNHQSTFKSGLLYGAIYLFVFDVSTAVLYYYQALGACCLLMLPGFSLVQLLS